MGEGLDFLMSFRLETNTAIKQAGDIFTAMRNMASEAVQLNLEAHPHFQQATKELKGLKAQYDEIIKTSDAMEKKQAEIANRIAASARKIDTAMKGAGSAIKKAFEAGGSETAMQKSLELQAELAARSGNSPNRARYARLATALSRGATSVTKQSEEFKASGVSLEGVHKQAQEVIRTRQRIRELKRRLQDAPQELEAEGVPKDKIASSFKMKELNGDLKEAQEEANSAAVKLQVLLHTNGKIVTDIFKLERIRETLERRASGGSRRAGAILGAVKGRQFSQYGDALRPVRERLMAPAEVVGHASRSLVGALERQSKQPVLPSLSELQGQMAPLIQQLSQHMLETASQGLGPLISRMGGAGIPGVPGIPGVNIAALQQESGGGMPAFPVRADPGILTSSINDILRSFEGTPAAILHLKASLGKKALTAAINATGAAEVAASVDAAVGRRGTRGKRVPPSTSNEAYERRRAQTEQRRAQTEARNQLRRAEDRQREVAAAARPIGILAEVGGVSTKLLSVIEEAKIDATPEKAKLALKSLAEITNQYAMAVKSAGDNGKADLLNRAFRHFQRQYITPLSAIGREADRKDLMKTAFQGEKEEARRKYMQEVAERFLSSQSAFGGLHKDLSGFPQDPYKAQQETYKKTFMQVLQYERELTAYTFARDDKERDIAERRIHAARMAAEISQEELNRRLLFNRALEGSKTVNRRALEAQMRLGPTGAPEPMLGFVSAGKKGFVYQQASLAEAYASTTQLLRQEFGPGMEALNLAQRALRVQMLGEAATLAKQGDISGANAKFSQAFSVKDHSVRSFVSLLQGGDPEALKMLKQNMVLNPAEQGKAAGMDKSHQTRYLNTLAKERVKLLSEEVALWDKLDGEIVKARHETELLARYDRMLQARQQDPSGYKRAAYGLSHAFGGYALGYGAGFAIHNAFSQYAQYEQETKSIQAILSSKSPMDALDISHSVGLTASKYGADLVQTAEAAKTLAQAGLNAQEVMVELDHTMQGMRAMNMTIDQMQELQIAIREVTDESERANVSLSVLEKMSAVERSTAVSAQQLSEAIKISAPLLKQFSGDMRGMQDVFDTTIGATTVMVEQLRVSGSRSGRALNMMMTRLLQPETLTRLQKEFGLKLAQTGGTQYLPLNEILDEIHTKYASLNKEGKSSTAQQMLAEVAGARQAPFLSALLNNYQKYLDTTTQSTYAFGDANERTEISLDSMAAKVQRVKTNFQLFFNNLLDGSHIADGLKMSMTGVADVLAGAGGQGMGSLGTLGTIAGGFGAYRLGKQGYNELSLMRDARGLGVSYSVLRSSTMSRRAAQAAALVPSVRGLEDNAGNLIAASGAARAAGLASRTGGLLTSLLGPTGVIVLTIAGIFAGLGLLNVAWKHLMNKGEDQYRIQLKTLEEMKLQESPQFKEFEALAGKYGSQGMTAQDLGSRALDAVDATKNPRIAAILTKYKASSLRDLLSKSDAGGVDKPQLAKELIDAFTGSSALGKVGESLRTAKDAAEAQEHLADATKLMGLAAWESVVRINQALEALQDTTSRMVSTTMTGAKILDLRTRDNLLTAVWGGIKDLVLSRATLQSSAFGMNHGSFGVGSGTQVVHTEAETARTTTLAFLQQTGMANGLYSVFSQSKAFGSALKEATEQIKDSGASIAEVLAKTAEILSKDDRVTEFRNTLSMGEKGQVRSRLTTMTREQALAFDLGQMMTQLAGINQATANLDPKMLSRVDIPAEDKVLEFLDKIMSEAKDSAAGQARLGAIAGNPQAYDADAAAKLAMAMKHNFLTLELGTDVVWEFQKRLTSLFLELYKNTEKLKAEERFASAHHLAYNAPEQRANMLKGFVQDLDTFESTSLAHILELQAEKQQLDRGYVMQGKQNAEGVMEYSEVNALSPLANPGARQELDKRREKVGHEINSLMDQLQEFKSGAIKMGDLFPSGPARDEWLKSIEGLFGKGGLINADALHTTRALADARNSAETRQVFLQKMGLQQSTQQLSLAEKMAELDKGQLDTVRTLTERQARREEIERVLLDARKQDLLTQRDNKEISDDDYKLKLQQLEAESQINTLYERRSALLTATHDLQGQSRQNLEAMLSGVSQSLSSMDIWKPLADALHGRGGVGAGRAMGDAMIGVLGPVADTFRTRLVENFTADLTDKLEKTRVGKFLGESPEGRMKAKILEAAELSKKPLSDGIVSGATGAALIMSSAISDVLPSLREQIVQGFKEGAAYIRVPANQTGDGIVNGYPAEGVRLAGMGPQALLAGIEALEHRRVAGDPGDVLQALLKKGVPQDVASSAIYQMQYRGKDPSTLPTLVGSGKLYRDPDTGWILYDSPNKTKDGKVPTHRIAFLNDAILRSGMTIDAYEQDSLRNAARPKGAKDLSATQLDPVFQSKITELEKQMRTRGYHLSVVDSLRGQHEQDQLFARGRSKPGYPVTWTYTSAHNRGDAVDFLVDGDSTGRSPGYKELQKLAQQLGLRTLGATDPGHIQYNDLAPDFNKTISPIHKGLTEIVRQAAIVQKKKPRVVYQGQIQPVSIPGLTVRAPIPQDKPPIVPLEGIQVTSGASSLSEYQPHLSLAAPVAPKMRQQVLRGLVPDTSGYRPHLAPGVIHSQMSGPVSVVDVSEKSSENRHIGQDLAILAANIAGTLIGGGGKGASIGSMTGSVVGGIAGGSIGGAGGAAVGSAIGSVVLGYLGGLFDPKDQAGQLQALQAIERVERDTLFAVDRQTDVLMNPESRYLNLPSNFKIPGYLPQFASSGGSASASGGGNTFQISIDARGANLSEAQFKTQVVAAMTEVLGDDSRNKRKRIPTRA